MACKYLLSGTYPLCTVVRGLMVPSLGELRVYCTSDQPSRCPLYQRYEATRAKIPLEIVAALHDATEAASPGAPCDAPPS
jgi:hypothetical protein